MTAARRQALLVFFGLGLIGILFFGRYLFSADPPLIYPVSDLGTDLPREIIPLWLFIKRSLATSGEVPLWRPYSASGAPIIGHPVAPLLYPPHWLSVGLPLVLGLNLDAFLHFWWLGLGTYLVLRDLEGLRWEAAAAGAVIFSFAPKWIAHLSGGHWPMLAAIAWWPWGWYGFRRYWDSGKLRWMVLLGIALAVQAINHGSYLAMALLGLGAATFGHMKLGLRVWVSRTVFGWGAAGIVFVGLSAGQIWPLFELLPYSSRANLSFSEITFGSLPPGLLLGLVYLPDLKFPEWFIYPGICTLILASYGWSTGWTRRERLWLVGALLSLSLSLGAYTPIYGLLLQWIPGFNFLRVPARWWIFTLFFLTLLASWGFERWINGVSPIRRRLIWSFGFLVVLSISGGVIKIYNPASFPFNALPSALFLILLLGLILFRPFKIAAFLIFFLVVGELLWAAGNLIQPQSLNALSTDKALANSLVDNAARGARSFSPYKSIFTPRLVEYDLFAADGYDSFLLDHYAAYVRRMIGCDFNGYAVSVPPTQSSPAALEACPDLQLDQSLARVLNIERLILPASQAFSAGELVYSDEESWVFALGQGQGRAYGVAGWKTTNSVSCLDDLLQMDMMKTALVESVLPVSTNTAAPIIRSRTAAANWEVFHVLADGPGLLVRSETWAPGWQVTVGGEQREVIRANCTLQGVWLEEGDHVVLFEYAPRGWKIGFPVSAGSAVMLAGAALWSGFVKAASRKRGAGQRSL